MLIQIRIKVDMINGIKANGKYHKRANQSKALLLPPVGKHNLLMFTVISFSNKWLKICLSHIKSIFIFIYLNPISVSVFHVLVLLYLRISFLHKSSISYEEHTLPLTWSENSTFSNSVVRLSYCREI